jgi:hypothetical protein
VFLAGVAHAQTNPVGTLAFDPPTGFDTTPPTVTTSGVCPAPSNAVHIRLQGPNGLDNLAAGRTQAGFTTTDPISLPFTTSFRDTAAADTPPATIVAGVYTVSLNCVTGLSGTTVVAGFVSQVTFTSPTAYVTTPGGPGPGTGVTTTTALAVTPASPGTEGAESTLTATVGPAAAPGKLQFKNGTENVGGEVPVTAGGTFTTKARLPKGTNAVTAVFTGTAGAFTNSTSAPVSYVVTPSGTGSGPVTTATTATTSPASPVTVGTMVTFSAAVSPAAAAGKVQFKDGTTDVGPGVPVSGGTASTVVEATKVGTTMLTAVFTPTDPLAFTPSTSTVVTLEVSAAAPPGTATTVPTPAGTGTPATGSGDALAYTGAPVATLVMVGLALSALGMGLLGAARRGSRV